MSHLVYVVENALSPRDLDRFGIGFMLARGNRVTVIDVGDINFPEISHDRSGYGSIRDIDLHWVKNRGELADLLPTVRSADFLITFAGVGHVSPRNFAVHRFVANTRMPFLIQFSNAFPGWSRYKGDEGTLGKRLADIFSRLKETRPSESLMARVPPKLLGLRPPAFMVIGGDKCRGYGSLVDKTTRLIPAHALDYEQFLRVRDANPEPTDTAVFLDEFLPFHPDLTMMGVDAPMEAEAYYACLRALFERIEKELNLEVVIAACPRADYDKRPDYFCGRRVVMFKSAELVAQSRLVIAHRSTAVNFAILFRKPLILTATHDTYRHSSQTPYFDGLAKALEKPIQFFDDAGDVDLSDPFAVDDALYERYIEDYIKTGQSPDAPYWQIVVDYVNASGVARI